jgi:hypothetical protein
MLDWILIILGSALTIAGIIGCIIPSIPGPPLNLLALLLINWIDQINFTNNLLIAFFIAVIVITIVDYLLPVISGKAYGASRYGIWGSMLGMIAGMIIFPPFGMLFGIVLGAIAGELYAGKENSAALKAGFYTFLISIFLIITKLALSVIISYHFFNETFNYIF